MTAPADHPEAPDETGDGPTWRDVTWQSELGLQARIYRPPDPGLDPTGGPPRLVIDVHGGAWAGRDRTLGHRYDLVVAEAGFTVVALDFRDGRQGHHPVATRDVAAGIGWARTEIGGGLDQPVALVGSSSGGHLALHVALVELAEAGSAPTGGVALVAALWPPVDPLARYRYARTMIGEPVPAGNRLDAEGLVASTEAYFGDESTMGAASIAAIVAEDRAGDLPPVWLVEAADDLNVPSHLLDDLVAAYRAAGGTIERTTYPGEIHGFGHGDGAGAERFRGDLVARLRSALPDPT